MAKTTWDLTHDATQDEWRWIDAEGVECWAASWDDRVPSWAERKHEASRPISTTYTTA